MKTAHIQLFDGFVISPRLVLNRHGASALKIIQQTAENIKRAPKRLNIDHVFGELAGIAWSNLRGLEVETGNIRIFSADQFSSIRSDFSDPNHFGTFLVVIPPGIPDDNEWQVYGGEVYAKDEDDHMKAELSKIGSLWGFLNEYSKEDKETQNKRALHRFNWQQRNLLDSTQSKP